MSGGITTILDDNSVTVIDNRAPVRIAGGGTGPQGIQGPIGLTSPTNPAIDVFAIGGQSNAQGFNGATTSALAALLTPQVPAGCFQYYGGTISAANDPVGNASPSSAWPAFCAAYRAATGRNILLVPSAIGGTNQSYLTQALVLNNWDDPAISSTGTLAPNLVANVNAAMTAARAASYTPTFRGILWSQGENDAGSIATTLPPGGQTTVTGGPYAAGVKSITVASGTGLQSSIPSVVITLDNGTLYVDTATVSGTAVTLTNGAPAGRSIQTGAPFHPYSQADYRAAFQRMLNYYRTTTIDGTTFPELPVYVSMTGGASVGYATIQQAQDQVAQSDNYTKIGFRGAADFIFRGMLQADLQHYLQEGYNEMGREMAKAVIASQADSVWLPQTPAVARIVLGGTLTTGNVLTATITSTAITGSPISIGTTVLAGDTWAKVAARIILNVTDNSPPLATVGIFATSIVSSGGAIINVIQPVALNPQATVAASWSGGATETVSVLLGTIASGASADIYYNKGNVSIGTSAAGPDLFNVLASSAPGMTATVTGIGAAQVAGIDNHVLRLYNSIGGNTIDTRVGILFQPAYAVGITYGGAIMSSWDHATGRCTFIFGGYNLGTWQENVRFGYDGTVKLSQYGVGTLVTDASGNVTAATPANIRATVGAGQININISGLNLGVGNTDTAISLAGLLPTGCTRYQVAFVRASGASAAISTATLGLFTATAGGGTTIVTNAAISLVTADGTSGNSAGLTVIGANAITYTLASFPTLFLRVGTAQTGTCNVALQITPIP